MLILAVAGIFLINLIIFFVFYRINKPPVEAFIKMDTAAGQIENAKSSVTGIITDYSAHMPVWQKWYEEALIESRKTNSTLIIIEKLEHLCSVYTSGKLKNRYKIELGPNWIGPKNFSGDKATNETDREQFEYGVLGDYALSFGQGYLIHGILYKRMLRMPATVYT